MSLTINIPLVARFKTPIKKVSLSTYFPAGTQYFYAYPAGEDSGFLNQVHPWIEELVAARASICAGPNISVVGFAATHTPKLDKDLLMRLGIPQLGPEQLTLLPPEIDITVQGKERNKSIKAALHNAITPGSLIMAQPYTDEDMTHLYQLPPSLKAWLNDKNHMGQYIRESLLPKRLGAYKNGAAFYEFYKQFAAPVVVKATASSSGDGVYLCRTKKDIATAARKLANISGSILVEQYIDVVKNYGIHFGIPYEKNRPIDLLGVNEQITTSEGEFLGGIITSRAFPSELASIKDYLLREVLPQIRQMGWYGIGGFDVLVDKSGRLHFIDCNFRMTGMSAYHFLVANRVIRTPLVSFGGRFMGSQTDFEKALLPLAGTDSPRKMLQLIALSRHGDIWNFNGALSFQNSTELQERSKLLLNAGIESQTLGQLIISD